MPYIAGPILGSCLYEKLPFEIDLFCSMKMQIFLWYSGNTFSKKNMVMNVLEELPELPDV